MTAKDDSDGNGNQKGYAEDDEDDGVATEHDGDEGRSRGGMRRGS